MPRFNAEAAAKARPVVPLTWSQAGSSAVSLGGVPSFGRLLKSWSFAVIIAAALIGGVAGGLALDFYQRRQADVLSQKSPPPRSALAEQHAAAPQPTPALQPTPSNIASEASQQTTVAKPVTVVAVPPIENTTMTSSQPESPSIATANISVPKSTPRITSEARIISEAKETAETAETARNASTIGSSPAPRRVGAARDKQPGSVTPSVPSAPKRATVDDQPATERRRPRRSRNTAETEGEVIDFGRSRREREVDESRRARRDSEPEPPRRSVRDIFEAQPPR